MGNFFLFVALNHSKLVLERSIQKSPGLEDQDAEIVCVPLHLHLLIRLFFSLFSTLRLNKQFLRHREEVSSLRVETNSFLVADLHG